MLQGRVVSKQVVGYFLSVSIKNRTPYRFVSLQSGGILDSLVDASHVLDSRVRVLMWGFVEEDAVHGEGTRFRRPSRIGRYFRDNNTDVSGGISSTYVSDCFHIRIRIEFLQLS